MGRRRVYLPTPNPAIPKFPTNNQTRIGLVGSRYYTSHLNQTEINKILLYLNFDMVSRGYFGVMDGDGSTFGIAGPPGSNVIEKLFADYLTAKGIEVTPVPFTGGSDYVSFMSDLKKPIGGLHTGAGVAQDPCYHQPCDNYSNANSTVLTINGKVALPPPPPPSLPTRGLIEEATDWGHIS